jgi:hypothetical protein
MNLNSKTCSICHKELPIKMFHKRSGNTGRLRSACTTCSKERYYDKEKQRLTVARFRANHYPEIRRKIWEERLEVLNAYGGKCVCCGETRPEFLALDHILGGGNKERKTGITGVRLIRKLKREGYPAGKIQILCHNCNLSIGFYGYCPHKEPDLDFLELANKYRLDRISRRD